MKALGRGFSAAPFKTFNIRFKAKTRGRRLSMHKDIEVCYWDYPEKFHCKLRMLS